MISWSLFNVLFQSGGAPVAVVNPQKRAAEEDSQTEEESPVKKVKVLQDSQESQNTAAEAEEAAA